ncbi:MAG: hypothetical protein HFI20_09910 [Lachnospiraceae bacterium]|jgi:uncharacterized protein (UPF0303 family)|nr:hypothetical protein [Lachnospiraceae bacterium]MCI9304926.1 hypothetical protein [Lachnospiraceae bacterium]
MSNFYYQESWLEILKEQEELLRYDTFTRSMALELGLNILKLAENTYQKPLAVQIVEDGTIIFAHKMAGTSSENDWWMNRKLAVSRLTGKSSLYSCVETEMGNPAPQWQERPNNYAVCGGCFPILPADGSTPWAYVLVSGMKHFEDHQVIADAMALQLDKKIRRVS